MASISHEDVHEGGTAVPRDSFAQLMRLWYRCYRPRVHQSVLRTLGSDQRKQHRSLAIDAQAALTAGDWTDAEQSYLRGLREAGL